MRTMQKRIAVILVLLSLSSLLSGCLGTFVKLMDATSTTENTDSLWESSKPTKEETVPEETQPAIPDYILSVLTDDLLFYSVELVAEPEGDDGTWEFSGNVYGYPLVVTVEDGSVTSVVMDKQHILYENGIVVMTIEDYRADEYKKKCQQISYKELARNPDSHKYDYFTFTGEVIQVYEDTYDTILRINVTPYTIGDSVYYTDTIYAEVRIERGADRILEDDIITVWGYCKGLVTYDSIFGQQVSIPGLGIEYYEIVE